MRVKFILSAFIVLILSACKKDNSITEQPLLQDGPMSAQLGKLIHLGNHGFNRSTPFWGRNSDELFITASTEILRVDLAVKKVEVVDNAASLVTGKTNENSGIIFMGKVNNQLGYYVLNYSTQNIEKIISVPENQGTIINIAGNNIFYSLYPVSSPNPPCTDFCLPLPAPYVPATFYHLDKQTQQITNLENKKFILFSPDGSRALLAHQMESRWYLFDNTSRTIIDSSDLNYAPSYGVFFRSGELHSFDVDVLSNITIKNFNTGQVLQQYQSTNIALGGFQVSTDGTKLYYTGGILNGNSLKILLYDLTTNTEKEIADIPFLAGGSIALSYFVMSDDNKKMISQYENDLYVKVLE